MRTFALTAIIATLPFAAFAEGTHGGYCNSLENEADYVACHVEARGLPEGSTMDDVIIHDLNNPFEG